MPIQPLDDRVGPPRAWITAYASLALLMLVALGIAGVTDRHSLAAVVQSGGPVDLGTMVLWMVLGVLAVGMSFRCSRTGQSGLPWLGLGALAFFFAGEEIAWGTEFTATSWDIHNRAVEALVDLLSPTIAVTATTLVVLGAVAAALRLRHRWWPEKHAREGSLPLFGVVALGWLVLSQALDLGSHLDLPYVTGQWILEESGEFLAALAAVFGLLAHRGERRLDSAGTSPIGSGLSAPAHPPPRASPVLQGGPPGRKGADASIDRTRRPRGSRETRPTL